MKTLTLASLGAILAGTAYAAEMQLCEECTDSFRKIFPCFDVRHLMGEEHIMEFSPLFRQEYTGTSFVIEKTDSYRHVFKYDGFICCPDTIYLSAN